MKKVFQHVARVVHLSRCLFAGTGGVKAETRFLQTRPASLSFKLLAKQGCSFPGEETRLSEASMASAFPSLQSHLVAVSPDAASSVRWAEALPALCTRFCPATSEP